jgi:hypothetical protein
MRIQNIHRLLALLGLSLALAFAAGTPAYAQEGNKYDDARQVLEILAESLEKFVADMTESETAEPIAKALNAFTASMQTLVPKINEIGDKYPEIKNEDTHPEALKPLLARIDTDFRQMMKAYAKVIENSQDPAVKQADDKYKQVMTGLK